MRKKIIAGNWKMNLLKQEAIQLVKELDVAHFGDDSKQMFLFPSSLFLDSICSELSSYSKLIIGAQNFYPGEFGAFTGENSIAQLKDIGVKAVLIGHSERREVFHESNEYIKTKVDAALEHALIPLFCCGESLEIREKNKQNEFVKNQLEESLLHLNATQISTVVIAYEPIWAIGTGKTASSDQAEEMHQFIRTCIAEKFGTPIAENLTILYGGSCKPDNAAELFGRNNIDGGLIGGASLKATDFLAIAKEL